MAFGANTWSNYTFLVIRGSREASSEFELVSQLFRFIVQHGWHSKKMPGGYHNMNQALFYQSRPLELTCGKYSGYLIELLKKDLGVAVPDKRRIAVFPENGRHVFREVFFHELGKWVMFDCDAGCIPVLNGVPLSMLELSLLSDAEFDAAVSTGLELYGRGPIGGRFGKGPAAKSWADGLLKETRHHFAIDDNWHFMRRSAEEVNDWKERVINPANPKHKKITVTNDPEAFRARFYSGKHQRGYRP